MKCAAAAPTCRKAISGCTSGSGRQRQPMFPYGGPTALSKTFPALPRGRWSPSSRAKAWRANNPIGPAAPRSVDEQFPLLIWLRPCFGQHLAHDRVLGEDLNIMLEG